MTSKVLLAATAVVAITLSLPATAAELTVGFSQIGSESGWRAAETSVSKTEADKRGHAQDRRRPAEAGKPDQGDPLLHRQGVNAIFLAPVVSTGWDEVLKEAKEAKIPVVLLDRDVDPSGKELYLTAVTSDSVHEGALPANGWRRPWPARHAMSSSCRARSARASRPTARRASKARRQERQPQDGPQPDRRLHPRQGQGSHGKLPQGRKRRQDICAVYAHNDDMAVGAIQAIKEAGLKPGTDILSVSIDAVPDIFRAMAAGEANATVELTPNMAGPALDAIMAFKAKGTVPAKWIQTESKLYTPADDPQKIYDSRRASATDQPALRRRASAGPGPAAKRSRQIRP